MSESTKNKRLYVAEVRSPRLFLQGPARFTKSLFQSQDKNKKPETPVALYLPVKR